MSVQLQTAVIAGCVALLTALLTSGISAYISWHQIRRERTKWLTELKSAFLLEILKVRLREYPMASRIIEQLSSRSSNDLSPQKCHEVAAELNKWFYSVGGLCADQSTRGAILGLRESCLGWVEGGFPEAIWEWRDAALFFIRRDLDLMGLDSFDPDDTDSTLHRLKKEMERLGA